MRTTTVWPGWHGTAGGVGASGLDFLADALQVGDSEQPVGVDRLVKTRINVAIPNTLRPPAPTRKQPPI
jgi:hypothetical protein